MFQLPARPTAVRVRTWRQLQRLGALFVRNSAYFLPASEQAREDFEWLRASIVTSGGEAMLLTAETVSAEAEEELVAAFRAGRRAAFDAVRHDAMAARRAAGRARAVRPRVIRELTERLAALESTDYFGGSDSARESARAAIAALHAQKGGTVTAAATSALNTAAFKRRLWVTRPRPGIDRFASAWLIRRFIDPQARFAFAASPEEAGQERRAVTFDMYGGDFGHAGGGCTFETLIARFELRAPGLEWLSRLVHALDLKTDTEGIPEAVAVARLVEGLREIHSDDRTLLDRGSEMIDALYRSQRPQEPDVDRSRSGRQRRVRRAR